LIAGHGDLESYLQRRGSGAFSLFQISETIGARLGIEVKSTREKAEPRDLVGNISAMRENLVNPTIRFDDGMEDLLP